MSGLKVKPTVNVTPLIDVLLVLLIIFLVVSPSKPSRFKTMIPKPLDQKVSEPPPSDINLRVDIRYDGVLLLNGTQFGTVRDSGRLVSKLTETFRLRTENNMIDPETGRIARSVFIKAPKSVKYVDVVSVIDAVKASGADPVGLQIDQLEQ